jgi:hypothetical protein
MICVNLVQNFSGRKKKKKDLINRSINDLLKKVLSHVHCTFVFALLNYHSLLTLHPWPVATPQVSPSFLRSNFESLIIVIDYKQFCSVCMYPTKDYPLFIYCSLWQMERCMHFWNLVQLALFCLKWQIMSKCKSVCFYGDWNERSICRWWYLGTAAAAVAADVQESIPDARKKRNSQICT